MAKYEMTVKVSVRRFRTREIVSNTHRFVVDTDKDEQAILDNIKGIFNPSFEKYDPAKDPTEKEPVIEEPDLDPIV